MKKSLTLLQQETRLKLSLRLNLPKPPVRGLPNCWRGRKLKD